MEHTKMTTLPIIECEITFLTEQEGGRKRPFSKGGLSGNQYRPHIVIGDIHQREAIVDDNRYITEEYIGVAFAIGPDIIEMGVPIIVELTLIYYPHVVSDKLIPGTTFTIREGGQVVGYGQVISPVNTNKL